MQFPVDNCLPHRKRRKKRKRENLVKSISLLAISTGGKRNNKNLELSRYGSLSGHLPFRSGYSVREPSHSDVGRMKHDLLVFLLHFLCAYWRVFWHGCQLGTSHQNRQLLTRRKSTKGTKRFGLRSWTSTALPFPHRNRNLASSRTNQVSAATACTYWKEKTKHFNVATERLTGVKHKAQQSQQSAPGEAKVGVAERHKHQCWFFVFFLSFKR